MSRGARGDLKVLRSFRSNRFAPGDAIPQEVRDNGDAILAKINKIKKFVKNQRSRETTGSAKMQWFTARERLKEELAAADREMVHFMLELAEGGSKLGSELREALDLHDNNAYQTNLLGLKLQDEIAELQALSASARRAVKRRQPGAAENAAMTRDSLYFCRSDQEQATLRLAKEASVLQSELQRDWPSAMGRGSDNDPLAGLVHVGEVQHLLGKYPGANQAVKLQAVTSCEALEAKFSARMQEWEEQFHSSGLGLSKATGGWSAGEHSAFARERAEAVVVIGGGSREAYLKRIATMLPGKTMKELMEHDDWYMQRKLMLDRRRTLRETWLRERKELLDTVRDMLGRSTALEATHARTAAETLEWEAAQRQLHDELEGLKQQRAVEEQAAAEVRAVEEAAADAEAARKAEVRLAEMEHKKMLICQYREENQRRYEAATALEEQEAQEQAKLAAVQAQINQERVDYRAAVYDMKREEHESKLEELRREEEQRTLRLEAIRAKVEIHAERDPERLLQPTLASTAEASDDQALFVNHGFTDEHLFKDQRFKLTTALAERGLLQTKQAQAYTTQLISNTKPARPPRPDNFTADQRMHRMHLA